MEQLAAGPILASFWESEEPALRDIRVWPIRGFKNHLIFYRVQTDRLEIVRVLHGAQNIEKALHRS